MVKQGYAYTTEGVFRGRLLKQPALPADHPDIQVRKKSYATYLKRRWLHNGCAVEELGRFGYMPLTTDKEISAFVWHVHDLLSNPQPIANNDGVGAEGVNATGMSVFNSRFVLAALSDVQISNNIGGILEEYFGFKLLAPYFGNVEKHYGSSSRMALYGLCCTRYLADKHQHPSFKKEPHGTSA